MRCNFLYVPSEKIGYGRMGIKLAEALQDAGVEIDNTLDPDNPDPAPVASWAAIPSHAAGWFDGQYLSILTMFEATRLPEAFREQLHVFDLVMVPSAQNVELFSKFHPNVKQVNLGIDPHDWAFRPRLPVAEEFRFLVGGSGPRKGTDLVVKAFRKLWGREGSWAGPTPVLLIKSPTAKVQDADGNDLPLIPDRMRMIPGHLTPEEERDLYGYAHCYVQPSRGEGFGLQPLQAIAQGCPTILTDAHGHASFARYGFPVAAELAPAAYFSHGYAGEWWEPNFDQLCGWMEYVYQLQTKAFAVAKISSDAVHREFTWDHTARGWVDAHDGMLDATFVHQGGWTVPDQQLFRAVLARPFGPANVGGTHYQIEAGTEQWVSGDLKRILYDGGYLDPACLDDTSGLTEPQIALLGEHLARDGYCKQCGHALNEGVTLADKILAEMP